MTPGGALRVVDEENTDQWDVAHPVGGVDPDATTAVEVQGVAADAAQGFATLLASGDHAGGEGLGGLGFLSERATYEEAAGGVPGGGAGPGAAADGVGEDLTAPAVVLGVTDPDQSHLPGQSAGRLEHAATIAPAVAPAVPYAPGLPSWVPPRPHGVTPSPVRMRWTKPYERPALPARVRIDDPLWV